MCIFADKGKLVIAPSLRSLPHTYNTPTHTYTEWASIQFGSMSSCFNKSNHEAKLISAWHNRVTAREKRSEKTSVSETAGSSEMQRAEGSKAVLKTSSKRLASHNPSPVVFYNGNFLCFDSETLRAEIAQVKPSVSYRHMRFLCCSGDVDPTWKQKIFRPSSGRILNIFSKKSGLGCGTLTSLQTKDKSKGLNLLISSLSLSLPSALYSINRSVGRFFPMWGLLASG